MNVKKLPGILLKAVGLRAIAVAVYLKLKYRGRRTYSLNYRGVRLKYNTDDDYSKLWFFPRYERRIHEPGLTNLLIEILKPNHTFVDVGANLGFFTCIGAQLCGKGRAISLEMDPKCIPLIQRNVSLNSLVNVDVVNVAVSDQSGSERIPSLATPNPELSLVAKNSSEAFISVQSKRLDDLFFQMGVVPDVLKIDAEGAEYKVLCGMPNVLKLPFVKILVEVHCEKLMRLGANYKQVLQLLVDNNFKMQEVVEHRSGTSFLRDLDVDSVLSGNVLVFASR